MTPNRKDDGQATVFVIGMALVALGVVAFSIEGTRAFLMRRTLQNAADAAAIAGASQLDRDAYYSSGGGNTTLSPAQAEAAAAESLDLRGLDARAVVNASPEQVSVVLRTDLPTPFLRLVGIDHVGVAAEAVAEPYVRSP